VELPAVGLTALLAALAPRPITVVRDREAWIVAVDPDAVVAADGAEAFTALDRAAGDGFWAGFLAYDLGRAVERIATRLPDDLDLPDLVLARHDARLVWMPGRVPHIVGDGATRPLLEQACRLAARDEDEALLAPAGFGPPAWRSSLSRSEHAERVAAIKELLAAGDCYQVNLTRRLTLDEPVDPVALFAAVHGRHPAPHAALLSFDGGAVVSASPELFLRVHGREVETRPIKGTARDAARLRGSDKDRAENVMIVDLARNDLGRVCEFGSIHVPGLCDVEAHPGLHHLVSTVRGRMRPDVSLGALLRATFPPASVTGAPKPRVLQAIEDLETVRRGVYCGAIGWIDATGTRARSEWSVAIRTFHVAADATHLGVGGGIVFDSDAAAEWDDTELKAHRLLPLVPSGTHVGTAR
jgi:para-aminobenzoate synthetase component I